MATAHHNSRPVLTRQVAWAAATDAGNRSMRKAGRKAWNEDDYNAATEEFNRLWPQERMNPAKLERCVEDVKKRGGNVNAYAVCTTVLKPKRNPESASAAMYASFHGRPSEEVVEFEEQEHFHENLAGLGVLVELRVHTVTGLDRSFSFDAGDAVGTTENPRHKRNLFGFGGGDKHTYSAASKSYSIKYRGFDLHRDPNNPDEYSIPKIAKGEWFDLRSAKREVDAVLADKKRMAEIEKREKAEKVREAAAAKKEATKKKVAQKSETTDYRGYTISGSDNAGFKVSGLGGKFYSLKIAKEAIDYRKAGVSDAEIAKAFRNPSGPIASATKFAGDITGFNYLTGKIGKASGKLDKRVGKAIGFKGNPMDPESERLFAHLRDLQQQYRAAVGYPERERKLSREIKATDKAFHAQRQKYLREEGQMQRRLNPEPISTSTTLLASNEDGTQLYFIGGDQSLDLDALKFSEIEQAKDLVTIGDCFFVSYLTQKDFDSFETICYEHELGEESGILPQLLYDTRNKRLLMSGGEYHIERPMMSTSPGLEN